MKTTVTTASTNSLEVQQATTALNIENIKADMNNNYGLFKVGIITPIFYAFIKSVFLQMLAMIWKKHKIFNSVIRSDSIYMMYNFSFSQKPAHLFLHYKTMFRNITSTVTKRMMGLPNKNIATKKSFTTFTSRAMSICTFLRTIFTKNIFLNYKFLITVLTINIFSPIREFTTPTAINSLIGRWSLKIFFTKFTNINHYLLSYKIGVKESI